MIDLKTVLFKYILVKSISFPRSKFWQYKFFALKFFVNKQVCMDTQILLFFLMKMNNLLI